MAGTESRSAFLNDDRKIHELSETIDAPQNFRQLGVDLLGSDPEVSGIIGQTSVAYSEVILRCLIAWRNEHGGGKEECNQLIKILRESGLSDQASWLLQKQKENQKCLFKDNTLNDLSTKIDGRKYCDKLGLKLMGSEARLSNMRGSTAPPSYKQALFQCLIRWRNQEGSSLASSVKLRKILRKWRLGTTVGKLEELEPRLRSIVDETDGSTDGLLSGETGELEAKVCL